MKLVSGIVDSGFFAQSALSAEVATKDSLGRNISETYLTGVDLTPYQTVEGMTAYQPVGSYLTADALDNVSGNWNEVSAKLDTISFSDVSGTFLTAVPDTYLQNTDLSTEDGKVTAISGIPLSAGGDVPEGVMVESGLEYNAVQEISGYNGSAIAQYGAEKQFIVHDDTLVHLSNSAQYALGVNLSAVAQLLGVDETVLWEGTTDTYNGARLSATLNLSENATNFNKIRIYTSAGPGCEIYDCIPLTGKSLFQWTMKEDAVNQTIYCMKAKLVDNTHVFVRGGYGQLTSTYSLYEGNSWWNYKNLYKIIGIGRKQ